MLKNPEEHWRMLMILKNTKEHKKYCRISDGDNEYHKILTNTKEYQKIPYITLRNIWAGFDDP